MDVAVKRIKPQSASPSRQQQKQQKQDGEGAMSAFQKEAIAVGLGAS